MIRLFTALGLFFTPLLAQAATFKEFVNGQVVPFVDVVVQLLYALAFLFFLISVVRFFFSTSTEGREQARTYVFWALIGFVVLFGVWGFVKLLLSVLPQAGV